MTDEELEKALNEVAVEQNFGSVCRIDGVPKNIAVIKYALDYINRLKDENAVLHELMDTANEREYRKKFISQVWENELGNELSTPDFDFIYKLYFEQREKLYQAEQKLAECENGYEGTIFLDRCKHKSELEQVRQDTAKEILQEVWNTGGTILSIQHLAAKYGVEINK